MGYPRSFIDEVRRSADPLQIIGEVVALKKRGSRWTGLCPFHDEKTPSFTVNDEGLWHCFGCSAGGDLIRFVMDTEGLGFAEAVRLLAEHAGVPIPELEQHERRPGGRPPVDRRRVMEVLAAADRFYRKQLGAGQAGGPAGDGDGAGDGAGADAAPSGTDRSRAGDSRAGDSRVAADAPGSPALIAGEFLAGRGFDAETISRFGLGFAPDSWEAARQHLLGRGFSETELEIAGLVKRRDTGSGSYDRLRRRIVFPIRDLRGRTIAFGGRVIDQGEPKYLNSPETPTFNKSRTLYGIFEGREAIVSTGFAVLVEGYFDLLACAQYGVRNAVAPLGTSFTEEHARLLARFTRKAVISFDGDSAGQTAAERTVGVFLGQGFQVNVVRLPSGHDPDSFLRAEGLDAFTEAMRRSDTGLEFLIRRAGERADLSTPRGKAEVLSSLLEFVVPITDRVERAEWIGRLAERLAIAPKLVEQAAADVQRTVQRRRSRARDGGSGPPPPGDQGPHPAGERGDRQPGSWRAELDKIPLAERELLRALLEHPEWRPRLVEICTLGAIRDLRVRGLYEAGAACESVGDEINAGNLLDRCEIAGAERLLSRLQLQESTPMDWEAARNSALGVLDASLKRRLREMSKDIREALDAGDRERFSELSQEKLSLAQRIASASA